MIIVDLLMFVLVLTLLTVFSVVLMFAAGIGVWLLGITIKCFTGKDNSITKAVARFLDSF